MIKAKITPQVKRWLKEARAVRQKAEQQRAFDEAMNSTRRMFRSLGRNVPFSIELWLMDQYNSTSLFSQ